MIMPDQKVLKATKSAISVKNKEPFVEHDKNSSDSSNNSNDTQKAYQNLMSILSEKEVVKIIE